MHDLFPSREYAIGVPVVLMCLAVTVVFAFLALVMLKAPSGSPSVAKARKHRSTRSKKPLDINH
jgi:hypothetical protein